MTEIQAADPGARKMALLIVAIILVIGILLLALAGIYQPALEAWLLGETALAQQKVNLILFIFAALLIPQLIAAVYFWRFGSAVTRAGRFPPPNYAVIRDIPVVEGQKAMTRGRIIKLLSVVFGIGFLGIPIMFWLVSRAIFGS